MTKDYTLDNYPMFRFFKENMPESTSRLRFGISVSSAIHTPSTLHTRCYVQQSDGELVHEVSWDNPSPDEEGLAPIKAWYDKMLADFPEES